MKPAWDEILLLSYTVSSLEWKKVLLWCQEGTAAGGGLQAEPGLEYSSGPPMPSSTMGRITHSHGGGKLTRPTSPNLSTPETPSQEGSLHKCCNVTPAATPGSHRTSLLKDLTHMVLFVYLTFSTERKKKKFPQFQRDKKPKLNKKL